MSRNSRSPEMRAAYSAVPPGWLPEHIRMTYAQLGGQYDLSLPAACSQWPEWHRYRETLYRIADGISAGDAGCTELATRYLILNYSGSYAGYLRALFARRLKHAALSTIQKSRLHRHFSELLLQNARQRELKECAKLWRLCVTPLDLSTLALQVSSAEDSVRQQFVQIFPASVITCSDDAGSAC